MRLPWRLSSLVVAVTAAGVIGSGVPARNALAQEGGTTGNVNVFLGVDLRISRAEVEIAGIDVEAGGNHLAVFAGYHW
ncbi:MAG TPA: hypothetical protein VIM86_16595 [Thermodesulfobacteriota bacterium]